MITCKFFQQGNCRYGQYCRYSHSYNVNFGATSTPPNKSTYTGNKNAAHPALAVAEEVLAAERGGQWILSCFGPFKERPCIPGMVDLSPEEYHWEMYQAQRNSTIHQVKLQFQQLCEHMKAKQALLKNPTREIVTMLETLQKGGSQIKSEFGTNNSLSKSSDFSFTTPQMTLPNTSTSASNLFASNPFRSNTMMYGTAGSSPSIFGGTSSSTTNSLFGAKPNFGNGSIFGGTSNASSTFGGTITSSTSPFPGTTQNTSSFNATMPQSGSVFNTQPAFGQSGTFNASTQANTPFGRLPISSSTNPMYSGTTTSTNVLFGGAAPAQISSSIFGGTQSATSMFGGGTQQANSMFSGSTASTNSTLGSTSLFAQPKTTTPFGGGPVFGGAPSFGAQTNTGIFGAQSTFGNTLTPSTTIFGGQNTTPLFGSVGQASAPSFGSVVKSPTSTFGNTQSTIPFGSVISTTNPTPFGSTASTANSPFISTTGPFTSTTAVVTPFSTPSLFGSMVQNTTTDTVFGTNQTSSTAPFDTITSTPNTFGGQTANASPFGQVLSFGNISNSSPFANTNTTITTTVVNPFASQSQKTSSPFGVTTTSQGTILSTTQSTPFGNSPFASTKEISIIDENAYSIESLLTDDEKAMYLEKQFTLGKIPLRPPTQELR